MKWIFRILALTALLTVAYMSLRPAVSLGGLPYMDKIMHFGAYGVLAGLARLGWMRTWGGWLFIGLVVFGISIEIAQHNMGLGRTGSIADTIANLSGAGVSLVFSHFLLKRFPVFELS